MAGGGQGRVRGAAGTFRGKHSAREYSGGIGCLSGAKGTQRAEGVVVVETQQTDPVVVTGTRTGTRTHLLAHLIKLLYSQ